MSQLTKPVWAEGMYLGPHHFQAQARYFEESLHFVAQSLWSDGYGFSALQIDADQLRNGSLLVRQARGLFADGLAFDLPGSDGELAPRSFGDLFPAAADHLTIYLAVPTNVSDGQNNSLSEDATMSRYKAVVKKLTDKTTGRDERTVKLGQKNLSFLTQDELAKDELAQDGGRVRFVSLPVVRIVRDGAGRYEADSAFVPPCLQVNASAYLTAMLARLTEILEEKSSAFNLEQDQGKGNFQAGLSARQVSQFWFLHALNSNVSGLMHILRSGQAHPGDLFREMLRLGGALCTFGTQVSPAALPRYDHNDLGPCFTALDAHIREHIDLIIPPGAISIPLVKESESSYHGEIKDERCLAAPRWILEVSARMGEADLIDRVPRLVKFCSAKYVAELVKRLLPGMTLTHLSVPPSDLESRVECQYFVVSRSGPCWDHIVESRRVGVYVPSDVPLAGIRLLALLNR